MQNFKTDYVDELRRFKNYLRMKYGNNYSINDLSYNDKNELKKYENKARKK